MHKNRWQKEVVSRCILGLAVCFFLVITVWPLLHRGLPMGYDPGLYRTLFLENYLQFPLRSRTAMPLWIQHNYPPLLGFLGGLLQQAGWSVDSLVMGRVVGESILVLGALYFFVRSYDAQAALLATTLCCVSFVQYEVFWRGYQKQLLGVSFLLLILGLWARQQWWVTLPLIVALLLTNRPGALYLMIIACIWCIRKLFHQKRIDWKIIGVLCTAFGIALPRLWHTVQAQILAFYPALLNSIDAINFNDAFQADGTFLTTHELWTTDRVPLVLGLGGTYFAWRKRYMFLWIASIVGYIRVFGQWIFFQRMMGYADLFWLACSGLILSVCIERWKIRGSVLAYTFIAVQCVISWRWIPRVRTPLISGAEFAFLQKMSTVLPTDAIVVVPDIDDSPRVRGYTERPTIAPGLFDRNKRGSVVEQRQTKWWQATDEEKCTALFGDYPLLRQQGYVWLGSKQPHVDLHASCFVLESANDRPWWRLYRIVQPQ